MENGSSAGDKFRVVFMGTPEFAVASLKALLDAGVYISAVVTALDKPQGRGRQVKESDVKSFARNKNLQVFTPEKLRDEIFLRDLNLLRADLFVVVAFRMLPEVVWSMPRYGTINLHASLLPDYRGAAPINHAIINGETKTGVTTFFIEKEIDTGKLISSEEVEILDDDNAESLHDKLMIAGAGLLVKTVFAIRDKKFKLSEQVINPNYKIKYAPKITKETCKINWNDKIVNIYNFIRGLSPYPGAWTEMSNADNKRQISIKIFETRREFCMHEISPGLIITDGKKYIKVAVHEGYLYLINLQAEGRKRLNTEDFLNGFKDLSSGTWNMK